MNDKRSMLRHFLAAIAYRTQKALRDAPPSFGTFDAGSQVRTPTDLVRHMTSVLGHARMLFVGGRYHAEPLADLSAEIVRFHEMLVDLAHHLETGLRGTTQERLLQGPLSDAMTHAGQLAMLRRLAGSPYDLRTSWKRLLTRRMSVPRNRPPSVPSNGHRLRSTRFRVRNGYQAGLVSANGGDGQTRLKERVGKVLKDVAMPQPK